MSDAPAIEAIGLTKRYGDFQAVAGIDLTVRRGEFMGLLGPNGAGKSTSLKAITGLIRPTSGTIRIGGVDIRDHRRAMARVGCVIETPEPYPGFTPMEVMEYVGRLYGLDRREIWIRGRDVLETVNMWEWRDKTIGGFSQGMRQRVVLAQALLPNPDTIILDEPTSGLDPRGMIEMRQTLASLKSKDRSLLISTHMLKEVSELCGSVTMIRNGRVIVSGSVSDLLDARSRDGVVLEVRTARPITMKAAASVRDCLGVESVEEDGGRIMRIGFKGTMEEQEWLTDAVFKTGLGILAMNEIGADLESMYMEMTDSGDVR